jgi:Ca2+-binding RTX toxin-like protein
MQVRMGLKRRFLRGTNESVVTLRYAHRHLCDCGMNGPQIEIEHTMISNITLNHSHALQQRRAPATRKSRRTYYHLNTVATLFAAICSASVAWANPTIQSIDLNPNPLIAGQSFAMVVAASPDVTQASATIDFHRSKSSSLQFSLTLQGTNWVASRVIPSDLDLRDNKDEAKVRVIVLDAQGHRDEKLFQANVIVPPVTAAFSGGILTVTGDDTDNAIVVSRDAGGNLLVNGGSVPISGGVSTIANTTLVRVFGLKGNDSITISDANGPMPPSSLFGGEGDDILTGSNNADDLDGGPGNDTLVGKGGADRLFGGPGNDTLIGGQGVDQLFGGEDNDQLVWNPGDGNDLVEGENGDDTLVFAGSNITENIAVAANGQRVLVLRDVGNIVMDCAGVEHVIVRAVSGSDVVTVNDLTGTEVKEVVVDLAAGASGDGLKDTVIVNATANDDHLTITGHTNQVTVAGLTATVKVINGEPANDEVIVNGLAGADVIDASAVEAGAIDLTLNGGQGDDTLIGGAGDDLLNGGTGADLMIGNAGDDAFVWNPGDANDTIEGGAGNDTLLFNGANIAETIDIAANGSRLRFVRNVASIVMDCNEVEVIKFNARGGADQITVNDLTGTGVTTVNLDLAQTPDTTTGDGATDTVIINGTNGEDVVVIAGATSVTGLPATINITGAESTDQLIIRLLDGDDVGQAGDLQLNAITLTIDGGKGADVLIGSPNNDTLLGGEGDDVLTGGPGQDVLDGGPGANVIIQD